MSHIIDAIWIGSCADSANRSFLKERDIEHIVCCAEEFIHPPGFLYISNKVSQWCRIPIKDNSADKSTEHHFREGAKQIDEWVEQGKNVLVHCYEGKSRSVAVVITYLMLYKGMSFDVAYLQVKAQRSKANIYHSYIPILKAINCGEEYTFLDS